MQSPIAASSVHTPISPCLGISFSLIIFSWISLNPFLINCNPFLLKGINYVEAPRASPIAIPKIEAIPDSESCQKNLLLGIQFNYVTCFV